MRRTILTLAVVLALTLLTTTAVYAKPKGVWSTICNHVVKPGETIYCIARAYGVDPWAIATHNGIANPNLIYSGQVLAIPNAYAVLPAGPTCAAQCPAAPACTCTTYHTVVTGNNLYRISLYYGVSMWRIAECNHIYNLNYIRVGDVLCIPTP